MILQIKRNTPTAKLPRFATEGSAGQDLYLDSIERLGHGRAIIDTGLSVAIPKDHVMLVFSRSGQAFKYDVRAANCVGVIDSDYRGKLLVKLTADSPLGLDYLDTLKPGDAIAQFLIVPLAKHITIEVENLDETARGEGGFGSTDQR